MERPARPRLPQKALAKMPYHALCSPRALHIPFFTASLFPGIFFIHGIIPTTTVPVPFPPRIHQPRKRQPPTHPHKPPQRPLPHLPRPQQHQQPNRTPLTQPPQHHPLRPTKPPRLLLHQPTHIRTRLRDPRALQPASLLRIDERSAVEPLAHRRPLQDRRGPRRSGGEDELGAAEVLGERLCARTSAPRRAGPGRSAGRRRRGRAAGRGCGCAARWAGW